jgi:hypothetical protein
MPYLRQGLKWQLVEILMILLLAKGGEQSEPPDCLQENNQYETTIT